MKLIAGLILVAVAVPATVAALSIAFGGPRKPPSMHSVNEPFEAVDFSGLPRPSHYTARDGVVLAYRHYAAGDDAPKGSVVLLHGSAADSRSMHPMARVFSGAGYSAYALDVRGHGDSGVKGDIAYVGQLEDDLEDFVRAVEPAAPATLAGFSAGGGFALRVAGSKRRRLFADYLLLSPFLGQQAPTHRRDSGGWVSVGVPRYVAIALLDAAGIQAFNHLPVVRYALDDEAGELLTPAYSFALARNYRPRRDYRAAIRAADRPLSVVAGRDDEVFRADRFEAVFSAGGRDVPVNLVPGVDHIGVTLEPKALDSAVEAVQRMQGRTHGDTGASRAGLAGP